MSVHVDHEAQQTTVQQTTNRRCARGQRMVCGAVRGWNSNRLTVGCPSVM